MLTECGRVERRNRLLPAWVVVYYVLALAMFSTCSYEEVMRKLVAGLEWASGWSRQWSIPTKAALFQARMRLGSEPLRMLYESIAAPLADPQVPGAFYQSWQLMSIDGLTLDVPDAEAKVEHFGRPPSSRGGGRGRAFPQVRVLGWPTAAFMRSSTPRWERTRRASRPWPNRSCGRCGRGCCCSPTADSSATGCGRCAPTPVPICCGG